MRTHSQSQKSLVAGFTLIELILYIALVSIFISGAILFAWDIIYGGRKSAVQREINHNMRIVSKRIEYEVRNASSINTIGANDICLASAVAAHNPTHIYISGAQVRIGWGGGSSSCATVTNDEPLTESTVTASNLTFTDRSSGTASVHVGYAFTISSAGDRIEWQRSRDVSGSVELRGN